MPPDDIDKLLADQKAVEDRKQKLIDALLKEKVSAVKDFDEKLAKLGYVANGDGKSKQRSHHKKAAAVPAKE
jgi:hypothetical protein